MGASVVPAGRWAEPVPLSRCVHWGLLARARGWGAGWRAGDGSPAHAATCATRCLPAVPHAPGQTHATPLPARPHCALALPVPTRTACPPVRLQPVVFYKKPFEFLNLGILAYLGNGKALSQVGA